MDIERLRSWQIPSIRQEYSWRDAALYALGLGYGSDPMDTSQLQFLYEDGLKCVPSICNTLAHPGFWVREPDLKIDWVKILHGEQSFEMHSPLPSEGSVVGTYRILSIEDKGAAKGAILSYEKALTDSRSGVRYFTVVTTIFMRGDGGQGGFGTPPSPPPPLPERAPDEIVEIPTLPQLALIYRLSGDFNPIHASPATAREAGFERPILHGLCTMGLATRALLQGVCDGDPTRLATMYVRFSRPVFPGDTIRTEIFREAHAVRFRCFAVERNSLVLDRGYARVGR